MVLQGDGRSCKSKGSVTTYIAPTYAVFVEVEIFSTTEKVVESLPAIETTAEGVEHIDAEALPLVTSNTGELVGMVVGGILSAVVITSLVG